MHMYFSLFLACFSIHFTMIAAIAAEDTTKSPQDTLTVKWYGGAAWRYSERTLKDGVVDNDTAGNDRSKEKNTKHNYKFKLGITGNGPDKVDWGLGLRTQSSGNSEFVGLNASGTDPAVAIEQGFFRYSDAFDFGMLSVALGRQKNVFAYDTNSQSMFSNDFRFDGLGWQWRLENFGFNMSQFLLGASSGGGTLTSTSITTTDSTKNSGTKPQMNYLFGFQPTVQWNFSDEVSAMLAVAYYRFLTDGYSNTAHGIIGSVGSALPASQGYSVDVDNSKIYQVLTKIDFPYTLQASAEWLHNKELKYPSTNTELLDRSALSLGLSYGKLKKAKDFSLGYSYINKGLGSNFAFLSSSTMPPGLKGHQIFAGYNFTDGLCILAKALFIKEKTPEENTGKAMGTTAGTSAYGTYQTKVKYWELVMGMFF